MKWFAIMVLEFLVDSAWSLCDCGQGGLCIADEKDSANLINAEPCSCDIISKGIFEPSDNDCNVMVKHCQKETCGEHGRCFEALGAHVCLCDVGWEGHECDGNSTTSTGSFIRVWYWLTMNKSWWKLYVSGAYLTATMTLTFEFEDGRIWDTRIADNCELVSCDHVRQKYVRSPGGGGKLWDTFHALSQISIEAFSSDSHYECEIPLQYSLQRRVFVNNTEGPVGTYHDVKISVLEGSVVHLVGTYRVFIESTFLEKFCPFELKFEGCGESPSKSGFHFRNLPLTLSVTYKDLGSYYTECIVKRRSYRWYIASSSSSGLPHQAGTERTISVIPSDLEILSKVAAIHVNITSHDIVTSHGFLDEFVIGVCFINLMDTKLKVEIIHGNRSIICGKEIDIVLVSHVIANGFPDKELEHKWTCAKALCGDAALNKSNLEFTAEIPCGITYQVSLQVFHEKSKQSSIQTAFLRFVRFPYNLYVSCQPDCDKVNPSYPLTLVATEEPTFNSDFIWSSPSNLTIGSVCNTSFPSRFLVIEPFSFKAGQVYVFKLRTKNGSITFDVKTEIGPSDVDCALTASFGPKYLNRYTITCGANTTSPPLTLWVYLGKERNLIATSLSHEISDIDLSQPQVSEALVWIDVMDSIGMVSTAEKTVNLFQPTEEEIMHLFHKIPSKIEELEVLLHEKNYDQVADEVDIITKLTHLYFPSPWNHKLLGYLARIHDCYWADCIIKTVNSVHRLIAQVNTSSDGVDDFIFKASGTLYTMTRNLGSIVNNMPPTTWAHGMAPVASAIHDAVRATIDLVDSLLFLPLLKEDIRRIHYRKVSSGNLYARQAMAEMGLYITKHMPHPTAPFVVVSGRSNENITVVSHHPDYINCILAQNTTKSYFQFLEKAISRMKSVKTFFSAAVVTYSKGTFWWSALEGGEHKTGEMVEVHLYHRSSYDREWYRTYDQIGPIKTFTNVPEVASETVSGEVRYPEKSEKDLDKYVNVHNIIVPRGYGALSLVFPKHLIGMIHTDIEVSFQPDFRSTHENRVLNSSRIVIWYYQGIATDNVYVGISSKTGNVSYSFNLSLIRCVIYSEDMWKSESCQYHGLSGNKTTCFCPHLSLINVETTAPKHSLVLNSKRAFYSETKINKYTMTVLCIILSSVLLLFIAAHFLDKEKKLKNTAMFLDDNYPGEDYPYVIAVYTGSRFMAGTSSHVAIRLIGSEYMSLVHILANSGSPKNFSRSQDSWFIMFTEEYLGDVEQIELWLDISGPAPDWFCSEIMVCDVLNNYRFRFSVKSWLTASKLHSTQETSFVFNRVKKNRTWKSRFSSHLLAYVRQEHRWISTYYLHPRSLYTHKERYLILMVLVLVTLTTCMALYMENLGPTDDPVIQFRFDDFTVSLISMLVGVLVTSVPILMFNLGKDHEWNQLPYPRPRNILQKPLEFEERIKRFFIRPIALRPIVTAYQKKARKKAQHKSYWSRTAATICCIIIITCAVLITVGILFFGRNKCFIWLLSSMLAISIEALLINPIQLIATAYLIANATNESAHDTVVINVAPLSEYIPYANVNKRLAIMLQDRVKPMYKPPLNTLIAQRAMDMDRTDIFDMIHILIFALMVILACIITYDLDVEVNYYKNSQLRELFAYSKHSSVLNLGSIHNRTEYFDYLLGTILPGLHRNSWYNGKPLKREWDDREIGPRPTMKYRGICLDYSTVLVGVPQLRQKRVAPNKQKEIARFFTKIFSHAYGFLTKYNEDTGQYLWNWERPKPGNVYYKTYKYWPQEKTKMGHYIGPSRTMYSGGGYVENLHWSKGLSETILVDLELDGWINNISRCVFVTLNLYNTNVDKISTIIIVTEILPSGVYAWRTLLHSTSYGVGPFADEWFLPVCVVLVSFLLTMHIIRTVINMSRHGVRRFMSTSSAYLDIAVISSGVSVAGSFTVRYFFFFNAFDEIESVPNDQFTSLYWPFLQYFVTLISVGVFTCSLSIYGSLHVHDLIGFDAVGHAMSRTKALLCFLSTLFFFYIIYASFNLYFFGASNALSIFYIIFFKESSIYSDAGFAVLKICFTLLIQLHIAVLVIFYTEAAAVMKTRRQTFIKLLILKKRRKFDYHENLREAANFKTPPPWKKRNLAKKTLEERSYEEEPTNSLTSDEN